jgi:hypothetical protein
MSCDRCGSESSPYCECYSNDLQKEIETLNASVFTMIRRETKQEGNIRALLETTQDLLNRIDTLEEKLQFSMDMIDELVHKK